MSRFARGWKLGKWDGLEIRVHLSLVVFLPYLGVITSIRFPVLAIDAGIDPNAVTLPPSLFGGMVALGYFLSIALHEFTHAWFARWRNSLPRSLVLMMAGGWTDLREPPRSLRGELGQIAVGFPCNLALAGIFFVAQAWTQSASVSLIAYCLANANLFLAILNLIPALPMDGGKALRAILCARKGPIQATQTMIRITRILAWSFGAIGFVSFHFTLVLIGIFIYLAAELERGALADRNLLEGLRIGDAAIRVVPIEDSEFISDAVSLMMRFKSAIVPVDTASGVPALLALSQVRKIPHDKWRTVLIRDLMEEAVQGVDARQPIERALLDLASAPYGVLPVREDGKWVGLVRYIDIIEMIRARDSQARKKEAA